MRALNTDDLAAPWWPRCSWLGRAGAAAAGDAPQRRDQGARL